MVSIEKEPLPLVRKRQFNHKLNLDVFANLPLEITIDILSRLPVRTVLVCKCVCKSWRFLIETHEFVKCHLFKSTPGLVVCRLSSVLFRLFEFKDELNLERHEFHYITVTEFEGATFISPSSVFVTILEGSVNGLLFLRIREAEPNALYICNLITREYIELPNEGFVSSSAIEFTYGFGVSKMTDQYKLVRIYQKIRRGDRFPSIVKFCCQVYTLGTGTWRSVTALAPLVYDPRSNGALVSGNLHWLVGDLKDYSWISCFDLETESFSTFSHPPLPEIEFYGCLVALGNCLCKCDNTPHQIVIWMMKEYGDVKSWTKELVISKIPDPALAFEPGDIVYPIKLFKDGDILMTWDRFHLFYYYNKAKTTPEIDMDVLQADRIDATVHASSFLSLKSFPMENVISF